MKLATMLAMAVLLVVPAAAQADVCDDAKANVDKTFHNAYDGVIAQLAAVIADMKAKGADPTKYYDAEHKEVRNLVKDLNDFGIQRDAGIREYEAKATQGCIDPNTKKFLQSLTDAVAAYITDGWSTILPKSATHVDFDKILAGYPLGGNGAVVPQLRDGVFNALGMGPSNDIRKAISDPAHITLNMDHTKDDANEQLRKAGLPFRF